MARFGLVGPAYRAQSVNADAQRCVNWYPEKDESGGGRSDWQLLPAPGLKVFCAPGFGPLSVLIPVPSAGRLFGLSENILNEFFADGTFAQRGVPFSPQTQPPPFAVGPDHFVFVNPGSGSLWVYTLATNALIEHTPSSGQPIPENFAWVVYLDGYYLGMAFASQKIYFSALDDPETWDALDVFQPSIVADKNLALLNDHRELWIFGQLNTLVYANTGDPDNPFQPNPSGFIQQGIAAASSVAQLDNTIFWLGGDVRGKGILWRANGYVPQRVSNHAVEWAWSQYSTISDAIAWCYQDQGHSFYVLWFPTADKTWVYDVATGAWHERTYRDPVTGIEHAHLARCHVEFFGKHLVGSRRLGADGKLFEMAIPRENGTGGWDFATDDGDPIRWSRRSPHLANEGERIHVDELQVFLETGLGPMPPLIAPFSPPTTDAAITQLFEVNGAAPTIPDGNWSFVVVEDGQTVGHIGAVVVPVAAGANVISTVPHPYTATGWTFYGSRDGWLTTYTWHFAGPLIAPSTGVNLNFGDATLRESTYREPEIKLAISRDGGHSFGNELARGCGMSGEFTKRVRWLRLGQARDFVFEISCSDPIPWRIIDASIFPDYPSSRLATNLRKQA